LKALTPLEMASVPRHRDAPFGESAQDEEGERESDGRRHHVPRRDGVDARGTGRHGASRPKRPRAIPVPMSASIITMNT
jgi:hypothetical protein